MVWKKSGLPYIYLFLKLISQLAEITTDSNFRVHLVQTFIS